MVVSLDLEARFQAESREAPFATLSGERSYGLRQVIEAIDAAAIDRKVGGLFATLGHASLGIADVQELRDAVARLRAAGKNAVLFAETIGDGGAGTLDYYLASAFGQVWLQPSGDVGLTGLWAESPFVKGTLDLLGIKPQVLARHEYKTAVETFTETAYSAAQRETLGRMLDSWAGQMAAGIAGGRKLPIDKAQALIGQGPFLPAEAQAAGLVDRVGYRDEAWAAVAGSGDEAAEEVDINEYAAHLPGARGAKVALILGQGAIHRGESAPGLDGEEDFGATTIAQAFRDAIEDEDVHAILFRVDSPGGSYTASDTVWREVKRARAAGKPVVVSMGNVAASGGYFVAMAADRVIAQPGTITGSIGVFSGKAVLADFWPKLGVTWDEMHLGEHAGMWSANRPFSAGDKARLDTLLDRIYADFTTKAVEGRAIPADRIESLARGRVWTGADAKAQGLVDALGGWHEATAAVREVAGLAPDAPIDLVAFPQPKPLWEMAAQALSGGTVAERRHAVQSLAALAALEPLLRPLTQVAQQTHNPAPRLDSAPVQPAGVGR
jgi:protease-4